jgi:DNA-binding response OmpR family regulator
VLNILLISDDAESCAKIEKMLCEMGLTQLTLVKSLAEGMQIFMPTDAAAPVTPAPEFNLILLDTNLLLSPVKDIGDLREVRKDSASAATAVCLLSKDKDPESIRRFLVSGVRDALVKPVMAGALKAVLDSLPGVGPSAARSMTKVSGVAELYYEAESVEVSEFDILIASKKQIPENEFRPIYGAVFQWTPTQRVLARCSKCEAEANDEGFFFARFAYVAVQPGITKQVRIWLKKEYVLQKERGDGG